MLWQGRYLMNRNWLLSWNWLCIMKMIKLCFSARYVTRISTIIIWKYWWTSANLCRQRWYRNWRGIVQRIVCLFSSLFSLIFLSDFLSLFLIYSFSFLSDARSRAHIHAYPAYTQFERLFHGRFNERESAALARGKHRNCRQSSAKLEGERCLPTEFQQGSHRTPPYER